MNMFWPKDFTDDDDRIIKSYFNSLKTVVPLANRKSCPPQPDTSRRSSRCYGLYVHDGGSAFVEIRFCPWCGARLPTDAGT